ncbi:MAG TPA: hypothetical protein VKS79_18330 [Gemmataceae bacterium]|nr:hypothetical protein [Gemmataceae bacterium]
MRKLLLPITVALVAIAGCALPPEAIKVKPLPADGTGLAWNDMVLRTRTLAMSATEAFYRDEWTSVEAAAKSLEQTALYLPKSPDIPAARKASVEAQTQALMTEAQALQKAAQAKDVDKTNDSLQKVHLRVRALGVE